MPATLALLYGRLSGIQGDEIGVDLQIERAAATAHRQGYTVPPDGIYRDDSIGHHSARKRDNIPAWDALLQRALTDPQIAAVIAFDMSRAFRNTRAMIDAAEKLAARHVKLILSVEGEIDVTHADSKLVAVLLAAVAEKESHKTSERLKDHYAGLKQRGIYFSHNAPMGLKRTGSAPNVTWEPTDDLRVIVQLCELYADGNRGAGSVALELRRRGLTWRLNGGARNPNITERTVRNALEHLELYQPFLDPVLYGRVLYVRGTRAAHKRNSRMQQHPSLLLRGLLVCGYCGAHYHTSTQRRAKYRAGGGYQRTYVHRVPVTCAAQPHSVAFWKLDDELWEFLEVLNDLDDDQKDEIAVQMSTAPAAPAALDYRQHRERLETRLAGYEQMKADGDITRERFLQHKKEIEAEIAALVPPPDAPARVAMTYLEARAILDNLAGALRARSAAQPEKLNELMRLLFVRIPVSGDTLGEPVVRAPFDALLKARA